MTNWIDPPSILEALVADAGRERAAEGLRLEREGNVRIMSRADEYDRSRVAGIVGKGEDEGFRVQVAVSASRLSGSCGCPDPVWPCRHVVALAAGWARAGEGMESFPAGVPPGNGWRQSVAALTAPPPHRPAAEGRRILVYWIGLEPGAQGAHRLELGVRLHRVGARGIGRGRPVSLRNLRSGQIAETTAEDRAVLGEIEGAGAEGQVAGLQAEIRGGAAAKVVQALARTGRVRWKGSGGEVGFDPIPIVVRLLCAPKEERVVLQARWERLDGAPWAPETVRVVACDPPWLESGGVLRPVLGVENGAALARLASGVVSVPDADLPGFLGAAVPHLESRGLRVDLSALTDRRFLVAETPRPRLYLHEEGAALVGILRFAYGDYEIEAENPAPVVKLGAGVDKVLLRRDMEREFAATRDLLELGFRAEEPGRFELRGDPALDFVSKHLDRLANAWEVLGRDDLRRHRLSSKAVSIRVRVSVGIDWLDLALEAEAEGEALPTREVLRALRSGSRYVRLGGGLHGLLPEAWVRRLQPSVRALDWRKEELRVPNHMAPVVDEFLAGVPRVDQANPERWVRLTGLLRGDLAPPEFPEPEGLCAELRPYQRKGYRWLRFMAESGMGCVLADDMGLGKTVQALAVLLADVEAGRTGPNLVVAPTSVVANWEAEAARFTPDLKVLRYHGADRKGRLGEFRKAHLVVTSYAVLRRDVEQLSAVDWECVTLDEAQAVKNAATKTAQAVMQLQARRRMALTGTPLENHLGELWSQFHYLVPGLLGSERQFARDFARPVSQGNPDATERLRRRIRPFILRRLKDDVARDLPQKVESVLLCEMTEEQERLYRTILAAGREQALRELRDNGLGRARFSVLEALMRLRQVCCHPEILPGGAGRGVASAKFDLFREFVPEVIEEGHRVLVFSQFVTVLGVLRRWLEEEGIGHLYLDGATRNREELVNRFQEDPSVAVFLVSLRAGGMGLNLTGADYVILFDPWWNPAVETQATDRAHRIGQTRTVFGYRMITKGTVEEKIMELQERKRSMIRDLIPTEEGWLGSLTREDIEGLFAD